MTHRKIHLWVSLVVGVAVWGGYFWHVLSTLGDPDGRLVFWFLGALALVILLEAVATGVLAWLFRRRARSLDDGPTLNAALRASHVSLMLLIAMILGLAALLAISALSGPVMVGLSTQAPVIAANILLALVVIAELVRAAVTLALMPRG